MNTQNILPFIRLALNDENKFSPSHFRDSTKKIAAKATYKNIR